METIHFITQERPQREMLETTSFRDSIFAAKHRPVSVATEFMEDWDVDDEGLDTEIEDDGENSPRVSLNSSGQPSFTTLSSYDEVQTPRSLRNPNNFPFAMDAKEIEGPRGPHLFRSSMASSHSIEFQHALSLSPLTPKAPAAPAASADFQVPIALELTQLPNKKKRDDGPFQYTTEELDTKTLAEWSPEKVAQWMRNAGVGLDDCDPFVENDITGAILITLRFEDLRELGITSFGVRTKIWEEMHNVRDIRKPEPVMETDIEDAPDRQARKEQRRHGSADSNLKRGPSKKRWVAPKFNDVVSPLESVSIVGIEQMMPRPHNCSKGENCAKWKRNQRLMEAFKKDHPFVDMEKGGIIMVAGDPGNAETAEPLLQPRFPSIEDALRPVSDAVPSVVASSDVMGPGSLPPLQYLQEATLRSLQQRDPQDNVRQFLNFQQQGPAESSEVPPTPPFEIYPAQHQTPHHGLRHLPKLSIPGQPPAQRRQHPLAVTPMISDNESVEASPEEATPTAPYRFGTPFSDMDVPVTAVPLGPVARDFSQSVPPDMNYRHNPAPAISRSMSRASARRPSFPVMPALTENSIVTPPQSLTSSSHSNRSFAQRAATAPSTISRPLLPPPRVQYPWTQSSKPYETAIAPSSAHPAKSIENGIIRAPSPPTCFSSHSSDMTSGNAISYQGLMKKRKTKMLRHEWHEHYFTLRGTRLAMHKDQTQTNRTLEYIDVDDYAIACSSNLAGGKLNAAFKAMSIRKDRSKDDIAAFSFQLIPQDAKGGVKLRKRQSSAAVPSSAVSGSTGTGLASISEGVNGTGKTHHFAVKGRDDRIDWMRELMLAKALKQKGDGVEITVNGKNMI